MKHSLIFVIALAAALMMAPQVAAVDLISTSATARLSQTIVSAGDPATASVNLHQRFTYIDMLCFDVTFVNDLFDPGEQFSYSFLAPHAPGGSFGLVNNESFSQAERVRCPADPGFQALFLDGKEHKIQFAMESGSVEIASLRVFVIGTPS